MNLRLIRQRIERLETLMSATTGCEGTPISSVRDRMILWRERQYLQDNDRPDAARWIRKIDAMILATMRAPAEKYSPADRFAQWWEAENRPYCDPKAYRVERLHEILGDDYVPADLPEEVVAM